MGQKRTGPGKHLFLYLALVILSVVSGCAAFEEMARRQGAGLELEESRRYLSRGEFDRFVEINQRILSDFPRTPPADEALYNLGTVFSHPDYPKRDYAAALHFFRRLSADFPDSPREKESETAIRFLEALERLDKDLAVARKELAASLTRLREANQQAEKFRKKIEEMTARQEEEKAARDLVLHGKSLLAAGDYEASADYYQKLLNRFGSKVPADEALFNLGLVYSHPGNPKKDYGRAIGYFRRVIKEFPQGLHQEEARSWVGILELIEETKRVDMELRKKRKELTR